jgi:Fe-S cluster assembly protein SufD
MNQYIELFNTARSLIDGHSLALLNARRDEAAAAFQRLGFPSRKVERYRYTDVAEAFAPDYGLKLDTPPAVATLPEAATRCYGTLADVQADALTALNTMLVQDVVVVHVPAGQRREHPVQLTNTLRSAVPLMQNRRLLIIAEAGAEVRVLQTDKAEAGQDFLTTQVSEIFVGEGAHVEFYDMEDSHSRCRRFHQVFAQVEAGGHLTHTAFTLASGLSRNQTDVRLVGEAADALLLGCAITDGRQHVDNNTLIDHRAPGCQSRELYKYVVDQQSSGAFAGRVLVRQEAQQTDSIERNANLVCTDQARMWTQPMLEIYADDVKCSHGSTLGQLNDEALFYMRQRGISDSEARMLLKQAFASEVLAAIPLEALRQRLHVLVEKRFRSCEDCKLCQR